MIKIIFICLMVYYIMENLLVFFDKDYVRTAREISLFLVVIAIFQHLILNKDDKIICLLGVLLAAAIIILLEVRLIKKIK